MIIKKAWVNYLQEWPEVPKSIANAEGFGDKYTVKITKDGQIEVTPVKAKISEEEANKGEVVPVND